MRYGVPRFSLGSTERATCPLRTFAILFLPIRAAILGLEVCSSNMGEMPVEVARPPQQPSQTREQCGFIATNLAELKRHMRTEHAAGTRTFEPDLFRPQRDAVPGSWQCTRCQTPMQDRRSLRMHVGFRACSRFDPDKLDEQGGLIHDSDIIQLMESGTLDVLLKDQAKCSHMTRNCVLCGAAIQYSNRVRTHLSQHHPEQYAMAAATRDHSHQESGIQRSEHG